MSTKKNPSSFLLTSFDENLFVSQTVNNPPLYNIATKILSHGCIDHFSYRLCMFIYYEKFYLKWSINKYTLLVTVLLYNLQYRTILAILQASSKWCPAILKTIFGQSITKTGPQFHFLPRLSVLFGFCQDCPWSLASCQKYCLRKMTFSWVCLCDFASCREPREPRQEAESGGQTQQEAIYHV